MNKNIAARLLLSLSLLFTVVIIFGCESDDFKPSLKITMPSTLTEQSSSTYSALIQPSSPPMTDIVVALAASPSGNGRIEIPSYLMLGSTNLAAEFEIKVLSTANWSSNALVSLVDTVITVTATSPGYTSSSASFTLLKPDHGD